MRGIVGLGIGDVPVVALSTRVFVLFARVNEALMAHEQVAPCKGLATEVAYEWFLLGVGADVALQVFLCESQNWSRRHCRGHFEAAVRMA